ncbi:MAG: 4-hydroxy-tetrahydrodipicolinate reductase [Chloroflexi bacterium]|nr:4-hydroxy-tetrahydrodipicolinate reductase [Chloroflexota bacterium]MCY3937397.1 4-hydroxy-tetrahydrodipicolinate reductase [Chloroflexota bacterium]
MRVIVCGAAGRVGRQMVESLSQEADMEVVGLVDVAAIPADLARSFGPSAVCSDDLASAIDQSSPEVVVDFTVAVAARENMVVAIERGVSPVVGTTGFSDDDIETISRKARDAGVGAFIAPNFSIGAVMLMRLSEIAASHFDHVEIIELHHDGKVDAPSGTALHTARMIVEARGEPAVDVATERFTLEGVRGGDFSGVKIHSVRLPGLVAHQEVVFGGVGQTLTLRHDSTSRESFAPGVIIAIRRVRDLKELVVGLDKLLFESVSD